MSGAGSPQLLEGVVRATKYRFDAVIIDEAAQAVEPSALIPLKYNPQVRQYIGCVVSFLYQYVISSIVETITFVRDEIMLRKLKLILLACIGYNIGGGSPSVTSDSI